MGNLNLLDCEVVEEENSNKIYAKRAAMIKKRLSDFQVAAKVTEKFLEENADINVDCIIDYIKSTKISTIKCAEQLGISPAAFYRLRKKYKIEPISIVLKKDNKKSFSPYISSKAVKHYYNSHQLKRIPQSEIDLVQERSARSLKLSGKVKWKSVGIEANGKLKPKTEYLTKNGLAVLFDYQTNTYKIYETKSFTTIKESLTRQEINKLNLQYQKLQAFV